jgi:hypothetical protein
MRRAWLAVPLIATAVGWTAAGCSSSQPSADGPLGPTFNSSYTCVGVNAPGDSFTIGGLYVQNEGHQVITITRFTLAGHGMVLKGALMFPDVRSSGLGAARGYPPPPGTGISAKVWATRRSPDGFQLKPSHVAALAVGMAPASRKKSTGYPVIYYTSGGTSYRWQSASGGEEVGLGCPSGT